MMTTSGLCLALPSLYLDLLTICFTMAPPCSCIPMAQTCPIFLVPMRNPCIECETTNKTSIPGMLGQNRTNPSTQPAFHNKQCPFILLLCNNQCTTLTLTIDLCPSLVSTRILLGPMPSSSLHVGSDKPNLQQR